MRLTKDLKDLGYSVIRGYKRRKKRYLDVREALENGSRPYKFTNNSVRTRGARLRDTTAETALELYDLYSSEDVRLIHAVDDALEHVTEDFEGAERDSLVKAILLNTEDGRKNPFEQFDICVSRSGFYRRREKFIYKTLENADYLNRLFLD